MVHWSSTNGHRCIEIEIPGTGEMMATTASEDPQHHCQHAQHAQHQCQHEEHNSHWWQKRKRKRELSTTNTTTDDSDSDSDSEVTYLWSEYGEATDFGALRGMYYYSMWDHQGNVNAYTSTEDEQYCTSHDLVEEGAYT